MDMAWIHQSAWKELTFYELFHLAVHTDVCLACASYFKGLPTCSHWSALSPCVYSTLRLLNLGHCCRGLLAIHCWCIETRVAFAGTSTGWVANTTGILLSLELPLRLVSGKASCLALQAAASCCVITWTSLCCPHRKMQRAQCLSSTYNDPYD